MNKLGKTQVEKKMNEETIDTNKETSAPKKGNTGKVVGCGCLVIILLILAGLVFVYFAAQKEGKEFKAFLDTYSENAALEIPQSSKSQETIDKFDGFIKTLKEGSATDSLQLTAQEINQLLQHYPDEIANNIGDVIYINDITDSIHGLFTLNMELFNKEMFKGVFINAKANYDFKIEGGKFYILIDSFKTAKGDIPAERLAKLNQFISTWVDSYNNNPENNKLMLKIERIGVSEGKLIIQPKAQ